VAAFGARVFAEMAFGVTGSGVWLASEKLYGIVLGTIGLGKQAEATRRPVFQSEHVGGR
jgi:hypothetical protein